MKRTMCVILAIVTVGAAEVTAGQRGRGNGHAAAKQERENAGHDGIAVAAAVRFSTGEIRVIRDYYAARYRALPPGLQKKVERGGELPPGWRKKMEPFPASVARQLAPLPRGYERGVIDGHAVIYDTHTHVMIDVAVLF